MLRSAVISIVLTLLGFGITLGNTPEEKIQAAFDNAELNGVFLMVTDGDTITNAPELLDNLYTPASTYKIFHSMIALEENVVQDSATVIPWDGIERQFDSWNRDHTLASALRNSVVWIYQQFADQIGRDAALKWLNAAEYGNATIGDNLRTYWLDGSLQISPREQVRILDQLRRGELPFSEKTMETTRAIMIRETGDNWVLRGKTGTALRVEPRVGWFVGWIEVEGKPAVTFATLLIGGTGRRAEMLNTALLKTLEIIPD